MSLLKLLQSINIYLGRFGELSGIYNLEYLSPMLVVEVSCQVWNLIQLENNEHNMHVHISDEIWYLCFNSKTRVKYLVKIAIELEYGTN